MSTHVLEQTKPGRATSVLHVRRSLLQRKCTCGGTPGPSGESEECRQKRVLRKVAQPSTLNSQHSEVPPIVHEVLGAPGQPLDPATRAFMDPHFGHDFGHVRVHTNPLAAESARAVSALAYTVGRDVVFGTGQCAPDSEDGRKLITHELTHVVQQTGRHYRDDNPLVLDSRDSVSEREADSIANIGLHGLSRPTAVGFPRIHHLQRQQAGEGQAGHGTTEQPSPSALGPVMNVGGMQIQIVGTAAQPTLPAWVPADVREAIERRELPAGITRHPGIPPWGDLVIWIDPSGVAYRVDIYQEYSEDRAFYDNLAKGDTYVANLLYDVYTEYNRDMSYFVEGKGYSPEQARNELRQINDEVFRLVIAASAGVLAGGTMPSASSVAEAAERTGFARCASRTTPLVEETLEAGVLAGVQREAREMVNRLRTERKEVVVNLGGEAAKHEVSQWPDAINVNPSPRVPNVPNLVPQPAQRLGDLFDAESVDKVVAIRLPLPPSAFDQVAQGAFRVLCKGGQLEVNIYGRNPDFVDALERAGFDKGQIHNESDVLFKATK